MPLWFGSGVTGDEVTCPPSYGDLPTETSSARNVRDWAVGGGQVTPSDSGRLLSPRPLNCPRSLKCSNMGNQECQGIVDECA